MFLTPIATKAQTTIASSGAAKKLEQAYGFVRRDGLNVIEKAKEAVCSKVDYFAPTTPIDTTSLIPQKCAKVIDFIF